MNHKKSILYDVLSFIRLKSWFNRIKALWAVQSSILQESYTWEDPVARLDQFEVSGWNKKTAEIISAVLSFVFNM